MATCSLRGLRFPLVRFFTCDAEESDVGMPDERYSALEEQKTVSSHYRVLNRPQMNKHYYCGVNVVCKEKSARKWKDRVS